MILVNLLPHREEARKRREQQFKAALILSVVAGLLCCVLIWAMYQARIALQENRNEVLQTEIAKLDTKIKDIAVLRDEIQALQARQQSVEDLQADRNLPVHLLDELVKQMPDGAYVNSIKQDGASVVISGVAQSQERVSQLLTNMGSRSEWFSKPDLIEIQAKTESISPKESRRVYGFSMSLTLVKPSDLQKMAEEAAKKSVPPAPAAEQTASSPAPAA